jgi:hypothetical protein
VATNALCPVFNQTQECELTLKPHHNVHNVSTIIPYLQDRIILQRRLRLTLLLARRHQPLRALGHHALLSLSLDQSLLLAQRKRKRDSQQHHARENHPHAFAAERHARRHSAGGAGGEA